MGNCAVAMAAAQPKRERRVVIDYILDQIRRAASAQGGLDARAVLFGFGEKLYVQGVLGQLFFECFAAESSKPERGARTPCRKRATTSCNSSSVVGFGAGA